VWGPTPVRSNASVAMTRGDRVGAAPPARPFHRLRDRAGRLLDGRAGHEGSDPQMTGVGHMELTT